MHIQCESKKFHTPQVFREFFPAAENFKLTFYMPVAHSHLRKITKLYSVVSNIDKGMPYKVQSTSKFFILFDKREKS